MLNRLTVSALLKSVILVTAQGTRNVSDNITGVKADADAAAVAADDVKLASETLETQSQQLGSQVSQFLVRIRAA
jgi:methyl-accepting chemotaxis protein